MCLEFEIEIEFCIMWLNECRLILIKITSMYRVKWDIVLIKFFLDFAVKRENQRD